MGTGYTRQSSSEIVDAQTIFASHFNNEFNLLESAFSGISGHSHDGTLGEGPLISLVNSVTGTLPIGNGGTGGTTAGDARTALGLGTAAIRNSPGTTVDNTLPRFDGVGGNFQTSNIVVSDAGVLTLSTQKITGVADGTDTNDVVNFGQLSSEVSTLEQTISDLENALELVDIGLQDQIDELSGQIGDFKDTARTLDSDWLRRDGSFYDISSYPDLADLMPELSDGVTWSNITTGISGVIKDLISYSGGYIIGTTSGSDSLIYSSTDGLSWAFKGTITSFSLERFASGAGIYVATDGNGKTAVSNDLQTWSSQSTFTTGASGLTFIGSVFVGTGVSGQIKTTPDGVSWTDRTSGTAVLLSRVIPVNGNLIALGSGGVIVTSGDDGSTWTVRTSGVSVPLNDASYGAGRYIVVGNDGTIITSTDLASWSAATSGTSADLEAATYSTSGFLVTGATGVARISANGISWTASPTGTSFLPRSVTFDSAQQNKYFTAGESTVLQGIRTLPTQFQVPDDNPEYGWIRALIT